MNATTPLPPALASGRTLTGDPEWLALTPEPVYAVLHSPTEPSGGCAALLLPTFGWDEECSYRRRRAWATQLAAAGIVVARFDFPGAENSAGSPLARDRARSWVTATVEAARWLRERSGCERVTAIGVGLGAMIAYLAAAQEAPVDDLVLWGVRSKGSAYMRELRAYAAVTASQDDPAPAGAGGVLDIGGHAMSVATATELSRIDLTELRLPRAEQRRVLLIGRDSHGIEPALRAHLAASGAELTLLESDEYHALVSPPDLGLRPARTVSASVAWIAAGAEPSLDSTAVSLPAAAVAPVRTVTFDHDGIEIRERLTAVDTPQGTLRGIISEPAGPRRGSLCLVSVNSGALRNTGPNRMFVEIARRAAAHGIPAARFDLPGLGDSDGTAIRSFERTEADDRRSMEAISAIYDHLEDLGLGGRFAAAGFSLGGYLTVRVAMDDPRVQVALAVNPAGFVWTDKQRKRMLKDLIAVAGPDALLAEPRPNRLPGGLRPLAARFGDMTRSLDAAARRDLAHSDLLWRIEHRRELRGLSAGLDALAARGTEMLLLLSADEQLLRMLRFRRPAAKLERCAGVRVERLPDRDHLLRPLHIQETVINRFIAVLLELSAAGEGAVAGPETPRGPDPGRGRPDAE